MNARPAHNSNLCRPRRGVAVLESAIVLGVFLFMMLGGLDLALAVLRNNTASEAARRLARAAIVRGESGAALRSPWGPSTHSGTAAEDNEMAAAIRDILVVVDPAQVRIRLEWPDGGNAAGDRVRASVTTEYDPIVASLFGSSPYILQATSTMRIEH